VVIDTVKKAEDSNDLILRLYESHGAHQSAHLKTALPLQKISRVDLLEDNAQPMRANASGVKLKLRPFEVLTLKITLPNKISS